MYTSPKAPDHWKKKWNAIEHTTLDALLDDLGKQGVLQLLIEGGGEVIHSFLSQNLAQKVIIFYGFLALGEKGKTWLPGEWAPTLQKIKKWELEKHQAFEDGICLEFKINT